MGRWTLKAVWWSSFFYAREMGFVLSRPSTDFMRLTHSTFIVLDSLLNVEYPNYLWIIFYCKCTWIIFVGMENPACVDLNKQTQTNKKTWTNSQILNHHPVKMINTSSHTEKHPNLTGLTKMFTSYHSKFCMSQYLFSIWWLRYPDSLQLHSSSSTCGFVEA